MKKLVLALCVGLGTSSAAFAADGVINITGQINGSTCQVNGTANGTLATVNVTLPTVSKSALATKGATAGTTPFVLNLTQCTGASAKTLFELGSTVDQTTGNLINQTTGGASNVQVGLLNSSFQPINITNNTNSQTVSISNNVATLNYYAQYVATGAATAGAVNTSVMFSMQYN
ncbi:fimbrial protein [Chromobacterium alticapitis]|nr:type 1 fimbrial protein [Chromobacterium alticapitis]